MYISVLTEKLRYSQIWDQSGSVLKKRRLKSQGKPVVVYILEHIICNALLYQILYFAKYNILCYILNITQNFAK